mmetsp:Transcript_33138/g.53740  ORF Transcript_33138/g.53740 Transcript_33138/m.53740 type:complete len:172 (-) Transcript_33138:603-1118(-)
MASFIVGLSCSVNGLESRNLSSSALSRCSYGSIKTSRSFFGCEFRVESSVLSKKTFQPVQIFAAQEYNVEVVHRGNTYNLKVPSDKTILQAGLDGGLDLPSSCLAGVCTTCSGQLLSGEVDQSNAVLSPEVEAQGFVLLCSAYPRSDCKVETIKEELVYEQQFGQYEYTKK